MAAGGSRAGKKRQQRTVEFSNKAASKELGDFPESIRDQFLVSLESLSWDLEPGLQVAPLSSVAKGVLELKRNGSPAYRLVYTMKFPGKVVVLAARPKTCNGVDRQLIAIAAARLKAYRKAPK